MYRKLTYSFVKCSGELHRGRDPWDDGQEEEHPQHVSDSSRGPWQVHADGFARLEGGHHRRGQGR